MSESKAGSGDGAGGGNGAPRRVVIASLPRLDTFCHATVHRGIVRVAGTLGTSGATLQELVLADGVESQTALAMRNIETILVRWRTPWCR